MGCFLLKKSAFCGKKQRPKTLFSTLEKFVQHELRNISTSGYHCSASQIGHASLATLRFPAHIDACHGVGNTIA